MNEHLKKIRVVLLALTIAGIAMPLPAFAAHGGGGHSGGRHFSGHGSRYHGGGGLGLGLFTGALIGSELTAPYYPYYYPYQGDVAQPTPDTYESEPVYQSPPNTPSTAPAVWYYCVSSKTYYPYVSSCPEAWKTVPASPPQP